MVFSQFARVAVYVLIVVGTGYSLLILHADAEFANFGRDALYRLIVPHVAAGERVWFSGQFAAHWYAPLAGATQTSRRPTNQRPEICWWLSFRGGIAVTAFSASHTCGYGNSQVQVRQDHGRRNGPYRIGLDSGCGDSAVQMTDMNCGGSPDRRSERDGAIRYARCTCCPSCRYSCCRSPWLPARESREPSASLPRKPTRVTGF